VAGTDESPRRDEISPGGGVVGVTFTSGVETVIPNLAARDDAARGSGVVAEACVPVRSDGRVVGVLDVLITRPLEAADLDRFRAAAAELGRRIDELGEPPAESAAQRMLRHMTSLSALDEPDAIARATLAAAIDLMQLDSAALLRRGATATATATAIATATEPDEPTATAPLAGVASLGPLGPALTAVPPPSLDAVERAAREGGGVVVATAPDLAQPELETLRAAGARTLLAVGLVAHGERQGLLLLAARTDHAVSIDDSELLELLAAHAATCLRTASLMRTLRAQAATDPLTGLGHHATFHATLAHAHRRPSTAVVLVDVDGFKRLNDTFGHQHGDHVLRELARALSGALRRGDTLFRIGGDEFAALLLVADADEALEAGRRLRAAVAEADLGVTLSIGVAVPQEGESDAAVLDRADRALYRVKAAGRDGVALAGAPPAAVTPPL
jgi:diguanylate cyclase (GGDEF)-like protein